MDYMSKITALDKELKGQKLTDSATMAEFDRVTSLINEVFSFFKGLTLEDMSQLSNNGVANKPHDWEQYGDIINVTLATLVAERLNAQCYEVITQAAQLALAAYNYELSNENYINTVYTIRNSSEVLSKFWIILERIAAEDKQGVYTIVRTLKKKYGNLKVEYSVRDNTAYFWIYHPLYVDVKVSVPSIVVTDLDFMESLGWVEVTEEGDKVNA